jgi:hypothetical protein
LTKHIGAPEKSFVHDLGADAMDVREIVIALEEEFDMQIPEADATLITTVYGGRGSEAARVRGDDSAGAAVSPSVR